jgi:hypothetical protein
MAALHGDLQIVKRCAKSALGFSSMHIQHTKKCVMPFFPPMKRPTGTEGIAELTDAFSTGSNFTAVSTAGPESCKQIRLIETHAYKMKCCSAHQLKYAYSDIGASMQSKMRTHMLTHK